MFFESEKVKDLVQKDCFGLGFKSVFHVTGKNTRSLRRLFISFS